MVVTAGQVAVNHAVLGRGGVDELTVAHIDARMGAGLTERTAGIAEEHQIAGHHLRVGDLGAVTALPLAGGGMRQGVDELTVHMHGETRTVKPLGRGTAVNITSSQELLGIIHDGSGGSVGGGNPPVPQCI